MFASEFERDSRALLNRSVVKCFTLIELLIVVAIISILAAIAVPNFLEAQTRSKVSRTATDLRSIATALEAYRVDSNTYPCVGNVHAPQCSDLLISFYQRLCCVTTPVAYITALPHDPFAVPGKSAGEGNGHPLPFTDETYCYAPGNFYFNHGVMETSTEYTRSLFSLAGRGPDCAICFGNLCVAHPRAIKSAAYVRGVYDATNGTISAGDIFRFGGTAAFN